MDLAGDVIQNLAAFLAIEVSLHYSMFLLSEPNKSSKDNYLQEIFSAKQPKFTCVVLYIFSYDLFILEDSKFLFYLIKFISSCVV